MTANRRSRWGTGLEGQRLPGYRVVVTEQTQRGHRKRHTFVLDADTWDSPGGPLWHAVRREDRAPAREFEFGDPLPPTVPLARGVDIPAAGLSVILDALVSQEQHRIDLADIKRIVSQLGSRIARLDTLPVAQRRLAEPALYAEILARCSSM